LRWAWLGFWGAAGLAMLLSSFWVEWFDIDFTWFKLNLGWFALVYSGLLVLRNLFIKEELHLTPRELHDWGAVLAEVTPYIMESAGDGVRTGEIADRLEKDRGLPRLVSLKYMIALSKELKKDAEGKKGGSFEDGTDETCHEKRDGEPQ
jgi:hypothetical protein